ncbi:extracellular tyrosine-protein kinase PKDCC-like [Amphiura filiformis]|uniref:extracellular tyrosine-protein kinase PKDCC-like n=1 Tax=Amphiura filiformis TaxID=82378 RepID=UPI003B21B610
MRIKQNHWLLLSVVTLVSFILFIRATRRAETFDIPHIEEHGRVLNKAEQATVRHLEAMVDDLQKQLWDAQRYEKQLIDQLKNINGKPLLPLGEDVAPQLPKQLDNQDNGAKQQQDFDLNAINFNISEMLGCQDINKIRILKTLGKGFSKIVQEGQLNGVSVAVKSAGIEVKDVQDCLKSGMYKKEEDCYVLASYKVLKEAMMLKQLRHPNIVRLTGLCLRSERSSPHIQERGMTVVVELGEPVQMQDLASLHYQERVRLCLGLAQLMFYLAESPLGSVAIEDFRDEQFVMIDKQIKLSDVDDLSSSEPECNSKMQCLLNNVNVNIKCASNMKCPGLNARRNLYNAYLVFFQPLLGFEVPPDFVEKAQDIMKRIQSGTIDAEELAQELGTLHTYMVEEWKPETPPPPVGYY